jgi:RNA polymerase sigma factor (sigma-70 family)
MVSENDEHAKELMYSKYKPLIITMACKYYKIGKKIGLEMDDFIQEGYFGLFQALSNYSYSKDCLFYTYAIRSISSKMHNLCIRNNTKGNQALNNSISLNKSISNDGQGEIVLEDVLSDDNSPNPWVLLDNYDFYKSLRELVYGDSFLDSAVLELKLNGFNIISISSLLDENRYLIERRLFRLKRKLRNSLHYLLKSD